MTARPPWDPDPRYVQPPEPVRPDPAEFRPGFTVPLLLAIAAVVVALLVLLAAAAPRPAQTTGPASSRDVSAIAGASSAGPTGAPLGSTGLDGSSPSAPSAALDPPATPLAVGGAPPARIYRGTATWYCSDGRDGSPPSLCTSGYGPSDLVAAIDRKDSEFRRGDLVVVRYGDRSVTVRIVDTCACVDARVIDLTIGAFQRLAPWGSGVIPVTLERASSLPETDGAP